MYRSDLNFASFSERKEEVETTENLPQQRQQTHGVDFGNKKLKTHEKI